MHDPEAVVYQSRDAEGNGFMQLAEVDYGAVYELDGRVDEIGLTGLTPELERQGFTEEDVVDGPTVVCLWPV